MLLKLSDSVTELVDHTSVPEAARDYSQGFRGAALISSGSLEEGLELMRSAADSWRSLRGPYCYPLDGVLAAAQAKAGDPASALETIGAIVDGGPHSEWWDSPLLRLSGEITAESLAENHGDARSLERLESTLARLPTSFDDDCVSRARSLLDAK